jgi:hypothetical protein
MSRAADPTADEIEEQIEYRKRKKKQPSKNLNQELGIWYLRGNSK